VFPILIDFGTYNLPLLGETHLFLPTYGFLFASSVLISWYWFSRRARGLGVSEDHAFNMCFWSLLAGIVGAKLLLVVLDLKSFLAHPQELLSIVRAGGVLLGGVILGALTFIYYVRRHDLPLFRLGDAIAAPLALAQSMGRLGCFSAGCCWGEPAAAGSGFAITFTSQAAQQQTGVPLGIPLVPVQLIEMTTDLVLVVVLTLLWRKQIRPAGSVFWVYMLVYSLARATIELWRGDAGRGFWFGDMLSTSQLLSIGGALFASAMLVRGALQRRRPAD
jgi:phosphatidylglycerol:prolipoprotein diacylglycerol transferase